MGRVCGRRAEAPGATRELPCFLVPRVCCGEPRLPRLRQRLRPGAASGSTASRAGFGTPPRSQEERGMRRAETENASVAWRPDTEANGPWHTSRCSQAISGPDGHHSIQHRSQFPDVPVQPARHAGTRCGLPRASGSPIFSIAPRPALKFPPRVGLNMHDDDGAEGIPGGGVTAGIGFVSGVRCILSASEPGNRADGPAQQPAGALDRAPAICFAGGVGWGQSQQSG